MKNIYVILLIISTYAKAQLPNTPALWLRADTGVTLTNNAVSTWLDISGNGNDVSQSVVSERPVIQRNVFNNLPAVFFRGTSFLNNTISNAVTAGNGRTVFVVTKSPCNSTQVFPISFRRTVPLSAYQATNTNIYYADANATSNNAICANTVFANNIKVKPTLLTYHHSANGKLNVRVNQAIQTVSQTGNTITESGAIGFSIGRREDNTTNSSDESLIAEIIVYDSQLSIADIAIVEAYLTAKYATNAPAISKAYAASSGKPYTATGTYTGYSVNGLADSNACVSWGSPNWGPQSATVDLLTPTTVKRFLVIIAMSPNGLWNGNIQVSTDNINWTLAADLSSPNRYNNEVLAIELAAPIPNIRYAKLTGTNSVSWIAAAEFSVNPDLVNRSLPGLTPVLINGDDSSFLSNAPLLIGQTIIASKAESYQWYLNGVLIPGEVSQSIVVQKSGNYKVNVTYPCATCNTSAVSASNPKVLAFNPSIYPTCGMSATFSSGVSSGAKIIDSTLLANNNFTYEAWFKTLNNASITQNRVLLDKGNTMQIFLLPNGLVYATCTIGGVVKSISNTTNAGDGLYHHIAVTYNGSKMVMYFDGDSVAATTATGTVANNALPLELGKSLKGTLDEVKIWSAALSKAIIVDNLDSTFTGAEANLVAYYNFNDNTANGPFRLVTNYCITTGVALNGITYTSSNLGDPIFDCAAANSTDPFCSIMFNNASDKITIPANSAFQSNSFSVSAYVKTTQSAPMARLITLHDGAGNERFSLCLNNGKPHIRFTDATGAIAFAEYSVLVNNNVNRKITATYNHTTGKLKLYVGSTLQATTTTTLIPVSNTTQYLEIGSVNNAQNYVGTLDEVAIYNKELNLTYLQNFASILLAGNEIDLIAAYNFNNNDVNGTGINIINICTSTGAVLNGITTGTAATPSFTCTEIKVNRPNCSIMLNGYQDGLATNTLSNNFWNGGPNYTMEFICKPTTDQHNGPYYTTNTGYLIGQHLLMQASANIWPFNTSGLNVGVATNGIHVFEQNGKYNHNGKLGYNKPITDWVHIAITAQSGTMFLYVNGKMVSSCSPSGSNYYNLASFGQNFSGNISEIRLWGIPLTGETIRNNINTIYTGSEQNLNALYRFNNNTLNGSGQSVTGLAPFGVANPLITQGNVQTPIFTCANYAPNNTTERVKLAGSGHCYHNSNGRANFNSWGTMNNTGTINMWVKPATLSGTNMQNIFSTAPLLGDNGGNAGMRIELDSSGVCYAIFGDDNSTTNATTNRFIINAGIPFKINNQYHIAITWNKVANTFSSYINGINTNLNVGNTKWPTALDEVNLGMGYEYAKGTFRAAEMDELCHWNIELTEAQIRERMTKKIITSDALWANLVNYYRFEQVPNLYNTTTQAIYDYKGTKHGIKYNSYAYNYSSSPIGDVSSYDYSGNTSSTKIGFGTSIGKDSITATITQGTADGIHVYGVQELPNTQIGVNMPITNNDRYAGVFVANGSADAKYIAKYNYSNNPFVNISNDAAMKLFKRDNNADQIWAQANNLLLDTSINILTCTGQFTEYILATNNAPLALTMLTFKAEKIQDVIQIDWNTKNEEGINNFIIERSFDGNNFMSIDSANASNGNGSYYYKRFDKQYPKDATILYYRLKRVDNNGHFFYSKSVRINLDVQNSIQVYPNPIKNTFKLISKEAIKFIVVINTNGQVLSAFNKTNNGVYDISSLPMGIYYLKVSVGLSTEFVKVIKE